MDDDGEMLDPSLLIDEEEGADEEQEPKFEW